MALNETPNMKKKYRLVPPDGKYGYAIVVAASVNLIACTMFYVCFGMIFNDFFKKLKMGSTDISLLTGIKALCSAVTGFLIGPLLKIMSKRQLAFVGCVFHNAGAFGAVFVNTKIPFFICQGLLQSVGLGFLYNISCVMVNDYFVERRMLFMTLVQTLASASSMLAPMLITWSMAEYGYQSTMIVMSAIGVHSFAACALLQPVSWHMRKVRVADDVPEKKLLLHTESTIDKKNNVLILPTSSLVGLKQNDAANAENGFPGEKNHSMPGNGNVITMWLKRYLDWPLFKSYVLTSGGLGIPVVVFADITYVYFLPKALYAIGWQKDQVKWAFALLSFGDIACRVFIILLSSCLKKVSSQWLYLLGLLLGIATRLALLWVTDYTGCLVVIGVMGASRCLIVALVPLVVSEYVGPDMFPPALGICFMSFGVVSIVMGPIIGAISDATQSHTVMFQILIGLIAAVSVGWIFELWWTRKRISLTIQK